MQSCTERQFHSKKQQGSASVHVRRHKHTAPGTTKGPCEALTGRWSLQRGFQLSRTSRASAGTWAFPSRLLSLPGDAAQRFPSSPPRGAGKGRARPGQLHGGLSRLDRPVRQPPRRLGQSIVRVTTRTVSLHRARPRPLCAAAPPKLPRRSAPRSRAFQRERPRLPGAQRPRLPGHPHPRGQQWARPAAGCHGARDPLPDVGSGVEAGGAPIGRRETAG